MEGSIHLPTLKGIKNIWHGQIPLARYAVMILLVPIFICPIVFMLFSSLKPDYQLIRDAQSLRAFLPVGDISLSNYRDTFGRALLGRFLFNSTLVTSLTVILGLLVNSMAGFSLVFLHWKGREFLLALIVALIIVPFETIVIPLLLLVSRLPWLNLNGFTQGWQNSYHVQIIPFIANAFSIYLFVKFFESIPIDFVEVARVDGASWFQVYWRVILPMSGPVTATVAILTFLPMWNQYLWPIMVIQVEAYRPVMVGFDYYQRWGEIMAYLSTITIPILMLFLALQQYFVKSFSATELKG